MGAATVMLMSGKLLPNNVVFAVADCGYSTLKGELLHSLENNHYPASVSYKLFRTAAKLQAGFDQQLTGRENISLRGQIIGLSKKQIEEIEPEVIEFAELGLYIDQPLRTYSSGMKARLGFAFAVAIDPEILVVDETLSVGDKAFQKKCIERIRQIMMNENVTVLFVTHSSTTAKEFCSRGIVLHEGAKVFDGSIEEASAYYEEHYAG